MGRSMQMAALALAMLAFAIWLAIATSTYLNGGLIAVVAICSGGAGWFTAVGTSAVFVSRESVLIRNVLRVVEIPASAVREFNVYSGLLLVATSGQVFRLQPYPPSLFKSMTGNRGARKFASKAAALIPGCEITDLKRNVSCSSAGNENISVSHRPGTVGLVVACTILGVALTVLLHSFG